MWRRDLAAALLRLSLIQSELLDRSGARIDAEEAMTLADSVVALQPADLTSRRLLCDALLATALHEEAAGRHDIAMQRRIRAIAVSTVAGRDPLLAAARVRALFALGRRDEAAPIVKTLFDGGYRDAEFLALTKDLRSGYR